MTYRDLYESWRHLATTGATEEEQREILMQSIPVNIDGHSLLKDLMFDDNLTRDNLPDDLFRME